MSTLLWEQPPYKKRKISLPRLKQILFLICDIRGEKVYNYKTCQHNCVYCSYDCLSVLMLKNMNNQENTDFHNYLAIYDITSILRWFWNFISVVNLMFKQ